MPTQKRTFRSYNPAFGKDKPGATDRKKTFTLNLGTINGPITRDIFRAFSEGLIRTISIISDTANAANINSYWKFDVQNATKGGASIFTQTGASIPNTSVTGLTANVPTDLYADTAFPGSYFVAPNDVLQLVITKIGFPPNITDALLQVDWEVSGMTTTTSSSTTTSTTTTTTISTSTSSTTTVSTSSTTTIT